MALAPALPVAPVLGADAAVREVHAVLDRAGSAGDLGVADAASVIRDAERAVARLQALKLAAIAVVDRARVADRTGHTGTAAWLAHRGTGGGAGAARDLELATALEAELPATKDALARGDLTTQHATVIARTAEQLPPCITASERARIEASMVAKAAHVDPGRLAREGRRELEAAGRTQAEVDAHEDGVLRAQEKAAMRATRLVMSDNHDGTVTGHFTVPVLAGTILRKVVQQMASPRRFAQKAAKDAKAELAATTAAATTIDATAAPGGGRDRGGGGANEVTAAAATAQREAVQREVWAAFRAEDLTWEQKYGQAFVELLEHLPTDHLSGKVAATIVVKLDHDQLTHDVRAAGLDTGHDISASAARRLACGAGILPAVLNGQSQVLDLGRATRFFTEAQRVATAVTYDTCAAEGCDRPSAWAELHHEDPWALGGDTNLDKLIPLCGSDHTRAHDPNYSHTITTDTQGRKHVTFHRRP
ncbi:HNH endonuclease signature motif containing protein [Knoellia koreensis]|uniref:DUF222 domain-containing protein n=1 Tax=Knoellia koreensis TaxID=2730921 RepID=A0A849HIX8_9MICO|nr:HNH endonuclease signature motif containing protein [Knoellia sp. DB2414S]NNM46271.1 DUF222 domain-containing protein [Knoellia sp. DB2414S]